MTKIILALATLATLSTASFAQRTDIDPRDRDQSAPGYVTSQTVGFAAEAQAPLTNFERVQLNMIKNATSSH